jgi:hypothetical protein
MHFIVAILVCAVLPWELGMAAISGIAPYEPGWLHHSSVVEWSRWQDFLSDAHTDPVVEIALNWEHYPRHIWDEILGMCNRAQQQGYDCRYDSPADKTRRVEERAERANERRAIECSQSSEGDDEDLRAACAMQCWDVPSQGPLRDHWSRWFGAAPVPHEGKHTVIIARKSQQT